MSDRCYGVRGTAQAGLLYCGNRAKGYDKTGRPTCGRCGQRFEVMYWPWKGDQNVYPFGTRGDWDFKHGTRRENNE